MNQKIHAFLMAVFCSVFVLPSATQAQFVPDGTTKTVNNITTNLGVDLVVGNTVANTTLNIINAGSVTANNGLMGNSSTASSNNLISVSGVGSRLLIPNGNSVLRIGNVSASNNLFIANGGVVSNGFGVIGFPVTASNNAVIVTNSGSVWNNNVLFVGENGSANSLTVAGGATTLANSTSIGSQSAASNNLIVVTGTNSLFNTVGTINIGDNGGGSQLRVSSAGTVTADGITIGNQATSGNNRLEVLGGAVTTVNGSTSGTLDVRRGKLELNGGVTTTDNLLVTNTAGSVVFNDGTLITRFATIKNSQTFVVGANPGTGASGVAFANTSQITIPVSGTINPASPYPATINVSGLGGVITKVTATISNFTHNVPADVDFLLVSPDGGVVKLLSGAGATTAISGVTMTFDDSSLNLPTTPLTSGTYICSDFSGRILPSPASRNVPYSVQLASLNGSNPNGTWSLFVSQGAGSAGQSGKLLNGWSLKIVTAAPVATWDVRSNAVTSTTVTGDLTIGTDGSNAKLLVTNGALVNITNSFNLGANAGSVGNTAIVGPAHVFIGGGVQVGQGGTFNTLLLTNGSSLTSVGSVSIGSGDFLDPNQGNNNAMIVTGSNSALSTGGGINVGIDGSLNFLLINSGGTVSSLGGGTIGSGVGGNGSLGANNQVTVTGPNSLWTNGNLVAIGANGSSSTLQINNSGTVRAPSVTLGVGSSSTGNLLSMANGILSVTNSTTNGVLDVRRGSLFLNGGTITADQLLVTNGANSGFLFQNGTLVTRTATISNAQDLLVGTVAAVNPAGVSFTNGTAIAIPSSGTLGAGAPYPSIINVFNVPGTVTSVTVTISNLFHTFPGDVDVLLVSPDGVPVLLMDATGGDPDAVGVTLTFDNASANTLPAGTSLASGTYHPTSYDNSRTLPSPAPVRPYSLTLAALTGANPNGAWSLYVDDAANGDSGVLSNGWSMKIMTTAPAATWDVRSNAVPTVVAKGLNIGAGSPNATLLVTNGGALSVGLGTDGATSSTVGANAASSNSLALVAGPNSFWSNAGQINVGSNTSFNTILITNGGRTASVQAFIGNGSLANNNQATVTGPNSLWTNSSFFEVGVAGSFNTLLIANGGRVVDSGSLIGSTASAHGNQATVDGANSAWINNGALDIGNISPFNTLLITNGGTVTDTTGAIGFNSFSASNNQAIVTGLNSLWTNSFSLTVGANGIANTLIITNGGTVKAAQVYVGFTASSTGNLLTVGDGTLTLTAGDSPLDVRRGQLIFNGGTIAAAQLLVTNAQGTFTFNAGDLDAMAAMVSNGVPFLVGDGVRTANYCMSTAGGGTHSFANGLIVTNHGSLTGSGIVSGTTTIKPGGLLAPGDAGFGSIIFLNTPALQGSTVLEISRNGVAKFADTVQFAGTPLIYGGSLSVSNVGPSPLILDDSFNLFAAGGFSGAFASIALPALPTGLMWTNKLLINGSLTVVPKTSPRISTPVVTGTNLSFDVTGGSPGNPWSLLTSTNVALPITSWTTNATGVFDWLGNVTVTNTINTNESGRFFLIYAP